MQKSADIQLGFNNNNFQKKKIITKYASST